MKNILMTGICGLIGANLSRALIKRGYKVWGIDNLLTGKIEYLHDAVSFNKGSISEGPYAMQAYGWPGSFDTIVHLASSKIPLKQGDAQQFLYHNTRALMNIITLAKRIEGVKLIFASTADVYGKQTNFSETADLILGPSCIARWSYAVSKLWSEHALYATDDLRFNIIRYCGGYGPYQSIDPIAAPAPAIFIDQALRHKPMTLRGDGLQKRCYCYIDDLVDGTIAVMESDYDREIFNLGNPDDEISALELADKIWNIINPMKPFHDMPFVFVPHSELPYEELQSRVPNIKKARELLGYEPSTSLKEGLKKTIEWQKSL